MHWLCAAKHFKKADRHKFKLNSSKGKYNSKVVLMVLKCNYSNGNVL